MALTCDLTDISLVLYGFSESDFAMTAKSLANISSQVGTFRILLSGTNKDYSLLIKTVDSLNISNEFDIIHRYDNLGFSGGHNLLLRRTFASGGQRCLVLNPDISMTQDGLKNLIESGVENPTSLLGPTLAQIDDPSDLQKLDGRTLRTDSLGIEWNADARHFDIAQGSAWSPPTGGLRPVSGVTGACLLVSMESFKAVTSATGHFFDELFVAYREDAELGIRASAVGIHSYVVPIQGVAHVRSQRGFARTNPLVNLLGVRNRFLIRWTLGAKRPGNSLRSLARDLVVAGASLTIERSSLPGLVESWKVRRFCKGIRSDLNV